MVNRDSEVERIFHEALDQPPESRRDWLEQRCGADRELFERVERLLRHDRADDSWPSLAGAVADNLDDALGVPRPQDRIGPYRIIEELGHGGMGRVFLAEREDVGKRVAIKVVRGALASPDRLERFRSEQRILARLEHPGIAQLLDAGVMEDGTPYFVMDRIDGLPLNDWIERADLGLEARLQLFLRICDAVTYAHGQLVVHRDIKPSNVMVTADGQPKLLDFGVARLLDDEGDTALTTTHTRIFTPAYASPEQLVGRSVTAATDVWQLGVLLYEMLAGTLPFDVASLPPPAAAQIVTQEEPRPPSRAAAKGPPDAARFRRRLRGDLDRIVLKCLEKDARRRYGSVEMLAQDLRRFLTGRPVAARAGGPLYRTRKFVRRHRVLTAAMIAALAWAGTVTVQNRAVARARETAEREADIARRVSDFLVDLFALARPTEAATDSVSVLTMVDSAAAQLRAGVDVDPAIEASMKEAIGRVYFELARYDEADSLLSDAVATRRTLLGEDHVETASAMYYLGQVAWANGQLDRADSLNESVLGIRRSQLGTRDSEYLMALQNQGTVRYGQARYEEAAEILTEALAIAREIHDEPHDDLSTILNNLANALWASGQREEARDMMEQSLDVGRRLHAGDHPNVAVRLDNLAFMSLQTGDPTSALRFGEEALDMYGRVYPGPHHNMTYPMATIADAAFQLGDTARADSTHRANVVLATDVLGEDHPDAIARRSDHAAFLFRASRYDESEAVYRDVISAMERASNETHPRFLYILRSFATVRQAQGEETEALSLLERAYETGTASLGSDDSRVVEAARALADALREAGDTSRAREIEAQLPDSATALRH
jgi:serine/threonine-protein kinase